MLPNSWQSALANEIASDWFRDLMTFVAAERLTHTVYPPQEDLFTALNLVAPDQVKAVILGQDPYHNPGEAHGLSFSVRPGIKIPPSLRNIFKELQEDQGITPPSHGCLEGWANQGVLLLNAVLTVRENQPNSHRNRGWERFTDAVIAQLNAQPERIVFVLWGANAQKKATLIDSTRHAILKSAHPSPLSVHAGFFGSRPFSKINQLLEEAGRGAIDWANNSWRAAGSDSRLGRSPNW